MNLEIFFDGACNNNAKPPLMGVGVVVKVDGKVWGGECESFCPGVGTNNIAEWIAFNTAMAIAVDMANVRKMKFDTIRIYGDSQLIVNQYNDQWEIKEKKFNMFYDKCKLLRGKINGKGLVKVGWIRRNFNAEADVLSKRGVMYPESYTAAPHLDVINYNNL